MGAISIAADLCTGCQSCEMICSLSHEGSSSPSLSRIQVKRWGEIAVYMPIVCQHCSGAPCITICPTGARKRIPETQAVITDTHWCVGCKSCIYACPYAAPVLHPFTRKTMTCDLCDGRPFCVDACTVGALSFVSEEYTPPDRRTIFAREMAQVLRAGRLRK